MRGYKLNRDRGGHGPKYGSALGLLVGMACLSPIASAEAQQGVSSGTAGPAVQLDEIVITAQKRTENVQDVPHAVTVISQEALDASGVTQIQDLGKIAPSVAGLQGPLGTPPPIRGVSSFVVSQAVQQQTGVVLDDIPQPSFSTLYNELSDVERIEVLPGPQSTLSGRNAAGGLINIVTRSPTAQYSGALTAEETNDDQQRFAGYISGPIVDTIGFSASGYVNNFRGNIQNLGENDLYVDRYRSAGIRVKLRWQATDKFSATLTAFDTDNTTRSTGVIYGNPYTSFNPANSLQIPFGLFGATYGNSFPLEQPGTGNRDVDSSRHSTERLTNKGLTLRLDLDTPIGTLTSLSALMNSSQPRQDNFISIPLGLLGPLDPPGYDGYAYTGTDVQYKSQEFRLVSSGQSRFDYLLGVIYTDTPNSQYYRREILGNVNWDRESKIKSTAVYGRGTWEFVPQTSITYGMRFQADQSSYGWQTHATYDPDAAQIGDFTGSSNYHFITEEVSLQHKFTDDIKAYFTFTHAETGEAYDLEDNNSAFGPYAGTTPAAGAGSYVNGLKPIPSEKVTNYELGVKTQWLDRRLTANADVFYAKYRNYQVQTIPPATSATAVPVIRLFAIGGVETRGAEFTTAFRATQQLYLTLNGAYLNAKITNYPGAQCYVGQTAAEGCDPTINPGTGGQDNLSGTSMPATPKFSFNGAANLMIPLSLPFDAEVGAFYRYQTSVRYDLYGDPDTEQGGFGILNFTAGIRGHNGHYSAELYLNNALNKLYYSTIGHDVSSPLSPFPADQAFTAGYARDSFRYGGVRFKVNF